jgi:hypothetical protein
MRPLPGTEIEAFRRDPKQYQAVKMLLDGANDTRDALERGNYVGDPQYGRWGSVSCPSWAMVPGSVAPPFLYCMGVYSPRFRVNDSMSGGLEVPADLISGGRLYPALRVTFEDTLTAGELVTWTLLVNVAPRGGVYAAAAWSSTIVQTIALADYRRDCILTFPSIAMDFQPLGQVVFSINRVGAATSANPYLFGASFSYQKGPFGLEAQP